MATLVSKVGGQVLPVPVGAPHSDLADSTVVGLLDFLAFMLNEGLDPKLASMLGTTPAALAPAASFPYDPGAYFVRNPVPALYLWWDGTAKRSPWTLLYDLRVRTLNVMYVYDQVEAPAALTTRAGLLAAVDATFYRAAEHGFHPSYGYNGDPPGTRLFISLGIKGWTYEGGQPGLAVAIPPESQREGFGESDGANQRGYLALRGTFTIYERVAYMFTPEATVGPGGVVTGPDANTPISLGEYTTEEDPVTDGILIRQKS